VTSAAVLAHARPAPRLDGDCGPFASFFDERGECVEGYYLVGLLAEKCSGAASGRHHHHDPRLIWKTTIDRVSQLGGHAVESKNRHAFIKERICALKCGVSARDERPTNYFRDLLFVTAV